MNTAGGNTTYRFLYSHPLLGERVYVAPEAHVSGAVKIGDDSSIWPMAVARGDVNRIEIGARCNVQDACVLHVTHESEWLPQGGPLVLGDDVTVGHAAVLHACTVGHRCLVGMGATVLDGAVLEDDVMIAAGSVVPPGKHIAAGTLWRGNPARFVRELSPREIDYLPYNAHHYVRLKDHYLKEGR